jgi:hypothetical protein
MAVQGLCPLAAAPDLRFMARHSQWISGGVRGKKSHSLQALAGKIRAVPKPGKLRKESEP